MKKNDYYAMGTRAAADAAAGLTDAQVLNELLQDRAYLTTMADNAARTAAGPLGVKKADTFFSAFRNTFVRAVESRQSDLREKAKPVFWGRLDDETLRSNDVTGWTLLHQLQEVRSVSSDLASDCRRIIRDAQATLARLEAQEKSKIINEKLYPVYDENIGRAGLSADVAIAKLRTLQDATRTMIKLAGMRLPTRDELEAAGLLQPVPPPCKSCGDEPGTLNGYCGRCAKGTATDPADVAAAAASVGLTVAEPDGGAK